MFGFLHFDNKFFALFTLTVKIEIKDEVFGAAVSERLFEKVGIPRKKREGGIK
jgi:hypothetical protein